MDSSPPIRQLGDYQLKQPLSHTAVRRTWLAEQGSIGRLVLIDELVDLHPERHTAFFNEARAKAAVDCPKIGSVYEAVDEPAACFFAYELLPGSSLTELQLHGRALQAVSLASTLQHVAEANIYLEKHGHSTSLLSPSDIHVEESGVVRLKNLAQPGPRTKQQSTRDIAHLGETLRDLVAKDWPGANRLLTLLSWMRGEGIDEPMTWEQVCDYCQQISAQLSGVETTRQKTFKLPRLVLPAAAILLLLGTGFFAWRHMPEMPVKPQRQPLAASITTAAGTHTGPDGMAVTLPAFRIAGHPVTNSEYMDFLKILQILAKDGDEKLFDHPEQPAFKTSHQPAGWAALNAVLGKTDKDPLLDRPITGVDWWDAQAYANWKKTRLPTQEEWHAALANKPPGEIYEWTQQAATNPANPLGEPLWVLICNGKSRQWIPDRSTRRTDLGFRIIEPMK